MEKMEENRRYKWSTTATNLLVSIWSNDKVQHQLQIKARNQPLWDSIAHCMSQKGFPVTGLQCRTRIKNMLCTYQEAARRKDPSLIDPFYDVFERIVHDKASKKKEKYKISASIKQEMDVEESDEDDIAATQESDGSYEMDQSESVPDSAYKVEYLESQDIQNSASSSNSEETMVQLEKIIMKATDAQSKTISKLIRSQTRIIERLLQAEREKLETILAAERESRKQLETRLDKILSKLESNNSSVLTYTEAVEEKDKGT